MRLEYQISISNRDGGIMIRWMAGAALVTSAVSAQAAYFNVAFLQSTSPDSTQVSAFDDSGASKVIPLVAFGLQFTGIDQNPADGLIYALGTRMANGVKVCRVVSLDLMTGSLVDSFPEFSCENSVIHDVEAGPLAKQHQFTSRDKLYRFNPARGFYDTYAIVLADGGEPVDMLATAIAGPDDPARPNLGVSYGFVTNYNPQQGPGYSTVGVTLAWGPNDFDDVLKLLRVQVLGTSDVPNTVGALSDTNNVSLDYPSTGNAKLFWQAEHYSNPYGFGSQTAATDHLCEQRQGSNRSELDGSIGLFSFPPNNNPGFMATCNYPSDRGIPNVVSVAQLEQMSFQNPATDEEPSSGGGALDKQSVLALLLLAAAAQVRRLVRA